MKRKFSSSSSSHPFNILELPFDMLVLLIGTFLSPFDIRNLALVGNSLLLELSREDRIWKSQIEKRIGKELKEGETLKEGEENWKERFRLTCLIGDWDPDHCSSNITIDGKKMKMDSRDWSCNVNVLGTIPGSYKVRISDGSSLGGLYMMIGLAPQTTKPDGWNFETCGFYISSFDGNLWSQNGDDNGDDNDKPFLDFKLKDGDVIEVEHNRENKTIGYKVNGTWDGIAFKDVPDLLFPSIEICIEGNGAELIF